MPVTPLDFFIRASDALVKFEAKFSAATDSDHSVFTLEIQGLELGKLWEKAKSAHEKCLDYFADLDTAVVDDIERVDHKYDVTYNAYVRCLASINERIHDFRVALKVDSATPLGGSGTSTNANSGSGDRPIDLGGDFTPTGGAGRNAGLLDNCVHNLALPPCDTDVFKGDYLSWPTFRDLFTAVYVNNSRLSEIERLCHLHRKTIGEAREIVSKFPLTNSSFRLAWRALGDAYDNSRMLVNNQLKLLFELPTFSEESDEGLKILRRGINGCLSALATYNVSTADWDPILVFMCIQRLPGHVVALWEHTVKNKSVLSAWKELDAFLLERVQTLECLRDLKGTDSAKISADRKVRTHITGTGSAESSRFSAKACVLCPKQNHVLRICPKFGRLSIVDRFASVKRHHACVNCLSQGHEVKECKSSYNCSVCNKRHHTLLHRDASSPEASTSSSSGHSAEEPVVASTSSGLNRQVYHNRHTGPMILGTAMVNIVHQGTTYRARALIDPASEASFISERLRNILRLAVRPTETRISGVDQSVAAVSRKVCSLTIGSPLDASLTMDTVAFVLPRISGDLPSFCAPVDFLTRLPNLRLADANVFDCRPVDLLLGADLYPQILTEGIRQNVLGSLLAQNTVFGWIITGPVNTRSDSGSAVGVFTTRVEFTEEDNLNRNLLRFWEMEETPRRKWLSPSDKFCEENFRATTYRDLDGRYVVTLPFKSEFSRALQLGASRSSVLQQFLRNERSLLRRPETKAVYDAVVREYLELGHIRPVESPPATGGGVC